MCILMDFPYLCSMGKRDKNIVQIIPVRPIERKDILNSVVASFQIEGIFIPDTKVQSIYARVNDKLKK